MIEREVKVFNEDFERIENELKERGAELLAMEEQRNIIFRPKIGSEFYEPGYLRIRETSELLKGTRSCVLTFKQKSETGSYREYIEHETEISDPQAVIMILQCLGFETELSAKKDRKSYSWDGIRFDFDTWEPDAFPKPYLEIEFPDKEHLEKALSSLQIDESHLTDKTIKELLAEWKEIQK